MSPVKPRSRAEEIASAIAIVGVVVALFGTVRTGAILLAVGGGAFSYLKYTRIGMKRRIELFLPLATACALLVVAITLPHGR